MSERRVLEQMLVTLVNGNDYVAERVWAEDGWLHLEEAQELTKAGRRHGAPRPYLFPQHQVRRVQPARRWDAA